MERDRELAQLASALSDASQGRGSLVVVEADAGLGKSRLLRWATQSATQAGFLTLSARSGEPERDFSFGVALQLFERWLFEAEPQERTDVTSGAAALSLPLFDGRHWGRVREPGEQAIQGLLHGLFWLTVNLSTKHAVLLAVDDLHWSDQPSLRFLLYLVERLEDLPVALVVTRRPVGAEAETTERLVHHALAKRLLLPPLSEAGVASLVAEGLDREPAEKFARACAAATGGNPFLVQAIVRALREDRIEPIDSSAEIIARLTPEVVKRHVLDRIARVGTDASTLAAAMAILGDGALLSHASAIAGLDADAAAQAADGLSMAGVLLSAVRMSFAHPLLRSAVYDEIPPAQRARAHMRAARLLHKEHRPSDAVAAHLLLSTRVGEAWAVETLRGAANLAAASGNPEAALRYLARALNEPMARNQRAGVLAEMARAKATIGEPGAEANLREALSLMEGPADRARAHQMLGTVLYTRGATAAAAHEFELGLDLLTDPDDPLARDLHAGYYSAASLVPGLAPRAIEHMRVLQSRGADGDTPVERTALAALAAHRATTGAPREETITLARRAWADGKLLAEEGPDGWAWSLVTGALSWTDEFELGLQACQAVIVEARRRGSLMAYATASFCALGAAHNRGSLLEARAHGQAALDARRYGWHTYQYAAAAWLAQVLIEQDEVDAAGRELEIIHRPEEGNALGRAWVFCVRAQLHLLRGDARQALADAVPAGEMFEHMGFANTAAAPWRPIAAVAAHRLGETNRAQAWLERELEIASGIGAPSHIATVLRTQAQLAGGSRAVELLREAVETVGDSGAGLEQLRCTADLGAALRRIGQRAEAREVLARAADQAHGCGARRIERQVAAELRVAGARPRRLSFSGPESLTASERRVAEMALAGLSNREIAEALFVTPRTVERHLYTGYKKLGITSRGELAQALGDTERDRT